MNNATLNHFSVHCDYVGHNVCSCILYQIRRSLHVPRLCRGPGLAHGSVSFSPYRGRNDRAVHPIWWSKYNYRNISNQLSFGLFPHLRFNYDFHKGVTIKETRSLAVLYNLKRIISLVRIKVRWKHSLFYRSPKLWKLNPTGAQLWMKTEPADTHPETSQILARMNQLGQLTWVTWVKKGDRMLSTIKTVMTTDYKWTDKKSMLQWIALVCIVNKFLYTHIYIYTLFSLFYFVWGPFETY